MKPAFDKKSRVCEYEGQRHICTRSSSTVLKREHGSCGITAVLLMLAQLVSIMFDDGYGDDDGNDGGDAGVY